MTDKNESVAQKGNYFSSHDGLKLFYRVFSPEEQNTAGTILLCLHGFAGHGESFTDLGDFLARSGITTIAPDHRSHGLSEGERGDVSDFQFLLKDASAVINQIKEKYPQSKLFLLGESMGGTVTIHFSAREEFQETRKNISGIILCAPGIKPKVPLKPIDILLIPYYLLFFLFSSKSTVIMTDNHYELGVRNEQRVLEMKHDPLLARRVSPRFVLALGKAIGKTMALADKITFPALLLQGTGDKLINCEGAKEFFKKLKTEDKEIHLFEGAYHGLFSDPEKENVKNHILQWLVKHQ